MFSTKDINLSSDLKNICKAIASSKTCKKHKIKTVRVDKALGTFMVTFENFKPDGTIVLCFKESELFFSSKPLLCIIEDELKLAIKENKNDKRK